jgi:hypothetical protein
VAVGLPPNSPSTAVGNGWNATAMSSRRLRIKRVEFVRTIRRNNRRLMSHIVPIVRKLRA